MSDRTIDEFFDMEPDDSGLLDFDFDEWGPRSDVPVERLSSEDEAVRDVNGSVDERRAESFGLSVGGPAEDLVADPDPPRRFPSSVDDGDRGDTAPDASELPDAVGQDLAREQEPSGWRVRSARNRVTQTDIKRAMAHGRFLREARDAPNSAGKRKASTGRYVGDEVEDAEVGRLEESGQFSRI